MTPPLPPEPSVLAQELTEDLARLPSRSTVPARQLRQAYSRRLRAAGASYVLAVALALQEHTERWVGWELVRGHRAAFLSMDVSKLETLGAGIAVWDEVDGFGRALAGPAWLHGLIDDDAVHAWARSPDLWWRRVALVCTVALNMRSQGGFGDAARTLAVCEMLAGDNERMVQQAISWALRELVVHDAGAVAAFVEAQEDGLSARTKREVRHKLATGLKHARRGAASEE